MTYWHDLHYAPATLDGAHKKEKREIEKGQTPSRNVTLLVGRAGCVGAGKWRQGQRHAQHVEPHMARGFPLLKARLT